MTAKNKTNKEESTTATDNTNTPQVQLMKIYIKDASLQIPLGVKAFRLEWNPELNIEINTQSKALSEKNLYEVSLQIKCTVKCKDEIAFSVDADQSGLFMLTGLDETALKHALGSFCPNILYPFIREAIGDMILRAGFPQLNLAPINFDALYQQQLTQQQTIQ